MELRVNGGNEAVLNLGSQGLGEQLGGTLHIGAAIGAGGAGGTLHHDGIVLGGPAGLFKAGPSQASKAGIGAKRLSDYDTFDAARAGCPAQIHLGMEPGREQNLDNNAGLVLGQSRRGIIHAGRFDINVSLVHAVFHAVSTLVQQGTHLFANQGDGFTAGNGVGTVRGRENIQNSHAPIV